jgi:hypothetical protein
MPHPKPVLTFWQIWNMCFGFLDLQFGFALQKCQHQPHLPVPSAPIGAVLLVAGALYPCGSTWTLPPLPALIAAADR